jgi:two-component system, OmpR family, phosphate regulon response regulator PhoB
MGWTSSSHGGTEERTLAVRPKGLVLVVEDHPDTQSAVAEHLTQAGFEVAVAANGDVALRLVREKRPNIVYLDMNLPHISGYDVCEQIRTDPELANIGILMTSAQSSMQVEAFCLEAGADAFVRKPFEIDEVAEIIARIMLARRC